MGVKEFLDETVNEPADSTLALGSLSFLGSIPLWLFIPIILISLGVGIYVTVTVLPFLVSGLVMFLFYLLFDYFDVDSPWLYVGPVLFGTIALLPMFVPQIMEAMVSGISGQFTGAEAVQAQGFIDGIIETFVQGPLWISAFLILIFLAFGLYGISSLGTPGAFISGFLGIALALAMTFSVGGLTVDPMIGNNADTSWTQPIYTGTAGEVSEDTWTAIAGQKFNGTW